MANFPKRIKFLSDENEAVLVSMNDTKYTKVTVGYYEYVVSKTKLGKQYPFTLQELKRMEETNIIEVMQ